MEVLLEVCDCYVQKQCKKENVSGVRYGSTMNGEVEKSEVRGETRGGGDGD